MTSSHIFIAGIGTDVGKTVVSAIFTEALKADYWKPVQSGDLHCTDSHKIADLISNTATQILPETYRFAHPASPHLSAKMEGKSIDLSVLSAAYLGLNPNKTTVIEGAGGLMVPLNDTDLYIDWLAMHRIPTVLVSRNYLGSINHTLLSVAALRQANIPILGIVFNGEPNPSTESIIIQKTNVSVLCHVTNQDKIDKKFVLDFVENLVLPNY